MPPETAAQQMHREILDRFGPDLAQGARERLESEFGLQPPQHPAKVAEDLVGFLLSDRGASYLRPDFKHNDDVPLLRRVLGRLPLDPRRVDDAARQWHMELTDAAGPGEALNPETGRMVTAGGGPPTAGRLARLAVEKLHSRDGEFYRTERPPLSETAKLFKAALLNTFGYVVKRELVTDALAEEWAAGCHHTEPAVVNRIVGERLQMPFYAGLTRPGRALTDEEIGWDREEFRPNRSNAPESAYDHHQGSYSRM